MLPRSCWALPLLCAAAAFFGWLGLAPPPPPAEVGVSPEVGIPPYGPFQTATGDERFQAEAERWDLSPPDSGHHQVPVRLRSSCTDLGEEEEVDLFNCQAGTEGHRTYPCTPDTDFLKSLSPTPWDGDEALGCPWGEPASTRYVVERQEELREWPAGCLRPRVETPVHPNLQQLALEETLIASGQHRVAWLMEGITQRTGNVSSQRATGLQDGHRLSNLHHAQENGNKHLEQIESHLALLLARERQMEKVMEKLLQVNRSLGLMLTAVEGAQSRLEKRLQQLRAVLDPAGQSPSAISTCILHGSFFVLLVVLLVLAPPCAILLLLFLATSALGQWLVATRRGAGGAVVLPREEPCRRLTSTPDRECKTELLQEELDRMEMSCLQEPSCLEQPLAMAGDVFSLAERVSPVPGGWRTKLSSCGAMLEPAMGAGKRGQPKPCSPSPSLASDLSSLSLRSPCQGLTRLGQRCRKKAIPGQDFCHVHVTGRASCRGLARDSSPHL